MPKIFERAGVSRPKSSGFDLSREQKLSCNMGELIPTYLEEVVPGDHFKVNTQIMMRLAPMLAPVMHRVDVYMHYFFVPNRIIWNQWEEFITGGRLGTAAPTYPTLTYTAPTRNSRLTDYFGMPMMADGVTGLSVSQLPYRAYQKIFQDYYRDRNLTADTDVNTMTADQLNTLRMRAWEKDYFTSALPWTQRGAEVGVPLDINYKAQADVWINDAETLVPHAGNIEADGTTSKLRDSSGFALKINNIEDNTLDFTINDLRRSSALQRWLEKSAIGGSRYIEQLESFFGVKPQDSRLQRPEYLGGGKQPIVISEVLNTTGTEEAPQGDMAGHGIATGNDNGFKYQVPEHGYIIGIMSVLPRTAYQQGIPRHFLRRTRFDYYFPEFAQLGEQEITYKELYVDPSGAVANDEVFGYQQRYAEYKYGNSTVHGDFRTSLSYWTMARIFPTRPALNTAFVTADPTHRIFAVTDPAKQKLWVQLYHSVRARRPMPHFANPKLQ